MRFQFPKFNNCPLQKKTSPKKPPTKKNSTRKNMLETNISWWSKFEDMVTDTTIEKKISLQHARVPTAAGFSPISYSCVDCNIKKVDLPHFPVLQSPLRLPGVPTWSLILQAWRCKSCHDQLSWWFFWCGMVFFWGEMGEVGMGPKNPTHATRWGPRNLW